MACEAEYYESEGACVICDTEGGSNGMIIFIIAGLIVVVLILCFVVAVKMASVDLQAGRKAFGAFTIGLTFWQIIAVFWKLSLDWPKVVRQTFELANHLTILSSVDKFVARTECLMTMNPFVKLTMYMAIPFMWALFTMSIFWALFLKERLRHGAEMDVARLYTYLSLIHI